MNGRGFLATVTLLVVAGAIPALAKKDGPPSVTHLPLWTVKGSARPQYVPGLTAALLLTPGQQEQLAQSWQETSGSAAVAAAVRCCRPAPQWSWRVEQSSSDSSVPWRRRSDSPVVMPPST